MTNATRWAVAAAALLGTALTACSGADAPGPIADKDAIPGPISVSVQPPAVEAKRGAELQFGAAVEGSTVPNVAWTVLEEGGGSVDDLGSYAVPSTPGTYHVVATSVADGRTTAMATVTVTGSASYLAGAPTASPAAAAPGAAVTSVAVANITAVPTGGTASVLIVSIAPVTAIRTDLAYSVTPASATAPPADGATAGTANGTVTADGVYTAPSTPCPAGTVKGCYKVWAVSKADPAVYDYAWVNVVAAPSQAPAPPPPPTAAPAPAPAPVISAPSQTPVTYVTIANIRSIQANRSTPVYIVAFAPTTAKRTDLRWTTSSAALTSPPATSDAAAGTVTADGQYTAPSTPCPEGTVKGCYKVWGVSKSDPTVYDYAWVYVAPAPAAAPTPAPAPATPVVSPGATQTPTPAPVAVPVPAPSSPATSGGSTPTDARSSGARVFYGYDRNAGAGDDPGAAPYGGAPRYAVASGGSSAGACGIGAPCTLSRAVAAAGPGDTIYLRGGTYRTPIVINKNGSASSPIELRSYPGEWAVFDGAGQHNSSSGFLAWEGASYWVIRNFEVKGYDDPGTTTTKGVLIQSGGHNVLRNLYSHHHRGVGIKLADSSFNTVENCTSAENYDPQNSGGNADGFEADHASDNVFRRCVSVHNSDDGYDANYSSRITYEDCVAANNGYGGGDGNGFKCAWPGYGDNTLTRVIAIGNQSSGIDDEMGGPLVIKNATLYNQTLGFRLRGSVRQTIVNATLAGSSSAMLNGASVTTSAGGAFGGSVSAGDFESVDLADLNNTTPGRRFFYPVSATLIGKGTNAGLPYSGAAPDIGAVESDR